MKQLLFILLCLPIIGFGQVFQVGDTVLFENYPNSVSVIQEVRDHSSNKNFKLKIYSDAGVFNRWSQYTKIIPYQSQNAPIGFGQNTFKSSKSNKYKARGDFNGYKYIKTSNLNYTDGTIDRWKIIENTHNFFQQNDFIILSENDYSELENKCEVLFLDITHTNIIPPNYGTNYVYFKYFNCNKYLGEFSGGAATLTVEGDFRSATNKALSKFKNKLNNYTFNSTATPVSSSKTLVVENDSINLSDESSIRKYFDKNGSINIEGIWEVTGGANYRMSIIKDDYRFKAYNLDRNGLFFSGDYKASFEESSTDGVFTINWKMGNKSSNIKTVGISKSNILIEFTINNAQMIMYKVFPKSNNKRSKKTGEWLGNGSGVIISKSGYIITNHHVIDDADDIEVEFILDNEVKTFNAEIVQSDKVNDLAIIKIVDVNFDGVKEIPYNFKTRSSDVGTKVYAFGYPMALSIMGKEIKVTDGIISSKTGFDGDITTYQISAPIQGGNSGGPLFDDKGNFIGINSSGINKKLADNVGYSIKTSYVFNLIDILPKTIDLPSNKKLASLPLTEQIKEISKYVVLVKVK